ncbi:MAG: aldehyde ferredoxin oxidoreductase family protein [Chloroflexota bacterium]|nr:aldehyde ferredoxin oxidoreductase family protein [Chloroflexota bacterium]
MIVFFSSRARPEDKEQAIGYHKKYLLIDLTTESSKQVPLDQAVLTAFLGGIGLGTYLLYKNCPPGIDPFSSENPLIFVTSPLAGSRMTTSSKFAVLAKSPLTGFIGDSLSSSFIATELKKTGFDALVIKGRSKSPTLLSIHNSKVEFLDASTLIGATTSQTESAIKSSLGASTRVACIGPAGENLVRFASISNDGGRQAGRCGLGAVMGSKNLKAVALKGTEKIPIMNSDWLNNTGRELTRRSLGPATEKYRTLGTIANVSVFNRLETLPTLNFQKSSFDEAEEITGEHLNQSHKVNTAHCANCTIGCEQVLATNDRNSTSESRMEYESAFALGPLVGISDPNSLIRASHACNEAGIDTISAGGTIAWAMESFSRNILTSKDTEGIDLSFGNTTSMMNILQKIVAREGIGELLAEGSLRASKIVGNGSNDWAMHVKGLEMPGYEPRTLKTMALGLAVSTRGACHNRSSAYEADFSSKVDRFKASPDRGKITAEGEDFSVVLDSLTWCKFLRKAFVNLYEESAEIYQHVTGLPMSADKLQYSGERINNLKKLFNIREGWTRADDTLPPRILSEKIQKDSSTVVGLSQEDLDLMISSYYKARNWAPDGSIPDSKLQELGLMELVSHNIPVSNSHLSSRRLN